MTGSFGKVSATVVTCSLGYSAKQDSKAKARTSLGFNMANVRFIYMVCITTRSMKIFVL
jgi:hypothetical protein